MGTTRSQTVVSKYLIPLERIEVSLRKMVDCRLQREKVGGGLLWTYKISWGRTTSKRRGYQLGEAPASDALSISEDICNEYKEARRCSNRELTTACKNKLTEPLRRTPSFENGQRKRIKRFPCLSCMKGSVLLCESIPASI